MTLKESRNIGSLMRWIVFGFLVVAVATPAIKFQPWTKIGMFVEKMSTPEAEKSLP